MKDLEGRLLGRKIFELRQRRHMTQKQLADAAGLSESALRSYELGDRNPKDKHLERIASALGVRPEAFVCREAMTNLQAIHLLFSMEDSFGIAPTDSAGCYLDSSNPTIKKAIRDWSEKRVELDSGETTREEYDDWKDTYNPSTVLSAVGRVIPNPHSEQETDGAE